MVVPGRPASGSSPRVRGSPREQQAVGLEGGFIPARAGEPASRCGPTGLTPVHPRACGGAEAVGLGRRRDEGSSPRVRGSRPGDVREELLEGFIPARAGEPTVFGVPLRPLTVHPRACGGASAPETPPPDAHGSSPRVRGSRPCPPGARASGRFIPARAGEPAPAPAPRPAPEVHPRACGGARDRADPELAEDGSSPRVRGSLEAHDAAEGNVGFIPARAGEPSRSRRPPTRLSVHPRACGGAPSVRRRSPEVGGSSPRVRGSPTRRSTRRPSSSRSTAGAEGRARFIPARAGEPGRSCARWPAGRVHPRACGGADPRLARRARGRGSSPRVRGSHGVLEDAGVLPRFIPARAGEPRSRPRSASTCGVHPRACGGASASAQASALRRGSSPRVRGSRELSVCCPSRVRFIPARAGEPLVPRPAHQRAQVHPRACGGALIPRRRLGSSCGSSPRVRGSPRSAPSRRIAPGFIPARAGEPSATRPERRRTTVHPRACGGARRARTTGDTLTGSSPRVRGSPAAVGARPLRLGFIPARAGEPATTPRCARTSLVHPRACGGAGMSSIRTVTFPGSSPRVRGSRR